MAEQFKEQLPLFTNCKLTICKNVSTKDDKLLKLITGQLQFKISGIDPVVIEKDSPSQQDINDLFETLKRHLEVQETEDYVFVSDVEEELRKNIANVKLEEKETISSSVETLITRTPEKYIQPTQQVGEKESQDALMSFSDDYIDSLTSCFQALQVAVGTEDQQQIKTPNTQKNVTCAENKSSRCESEQASKLKETNKLEASVYSVTKENNKFETSVYSDPKETNKLEASVYSVTKENNKFETSVYSDPKETNKFETSVYSDPKETNKFETSVYSVPKETNKFETSVYSVPKETNKFETSVYSDPKETNKPETSVYSVPKETNKFETSVYSVPKETNTDFSKTNNKIAVLKMAHDSGKSLQEEKKSNKTATEVQRQVKESVARSKGGGDSSSNSEILPEPNSETPGNKIEIRPEYTQEVTEVAKGQPLGQMCKDEKINVSQEAECRMEADMDIDFFSNSLNSNAKTYCVENKKQSVDCIGESPSAGEEKSIQQTRFGNSYAQKFMEINEDFKQVESCSKQNVPLIPKFEQTTQFDAETHKISKCRCNITEEPTREQGDGGLVTADIDHIMDKIQKQTEDTFCRKVDQSQSMTGGHSLADIVSTTESSLPKTKRDNKIISHGSHNVMGFAGNYNDDEQLSAYIRKYGEHFETKAASRQALEEHDKKKVRDEDRKGKQNLTSERTLNDDSAHKQPLPGNSRWKSDEKKSAEVEKTEVPHSSTRQTSTKQEDSSESDEESRDLIYSLTAPAFKVAHFHFQKSKFSSYFQDAKEESTGFTFQLDERDKKNVKFINTIKNMRFEEYSFVNEERKSNLESVIADIESEVKESKLYLVDKKIYIVGAKDVVKLVRKELASRLSLDGARSHDPLGDRNRTDDNPTQTSRKTEEKKYDSKRNPLTNDREFGGREKGESLSLLSNPKQSADKQDGSTSFLLARSHDYGRTHSGASGYGGAYSIAQSDSRVVADTRNLKVKVYNADITKLEVDCIVNAANRKLQHFGGVARVISEAAGPSLKMECEDFIKAGNSVEETNVFVSNAGRLPAKRVIHAVGPKWDSYDHESKPQCLKNLRQTVLRCLVEANRRGLTSIALPSISAAIFKVPKEKCARCYMEAVQHFDVVSDENPSSLKEIHFVDIDDTMVNYIKECFRSGFNIPCDPEIARKDLEDLRRPHQQSKSRNEASTHPTKSFQKNTSSDHSKSSTASSSGRPTGKSEIGESYQIGNITLLIDRKAAFDHRSDITITIGKLFDKLSGLQDFQVKNTKTEGNTIKNVFKKNKFEYLDVFKPDGKTSRLVLTVYPEPESPDKIEEAFKNLEEAFHRSDQNVTKLVLTSSALYAEPGNKQNKKERKIDSKICGKFAQCLFEYLKNLKSPQTYTVIVVGSEDALSKIKRVLESRGLKKIAPGAYPQTSQGAPRSGDFGAKSSEHQKFSGAPGFEAKSFEHQKFGPPSPEMSTSMSSWSQKLGTSVDSPVTCEICYENKPSYPVLCCKKFLCHDCEQKVSICPFCRKIWRILTGDQPPGFMRVDMIWDCCPGYEGFPTWKIEYLFSPGVQQACHPSPGRRFNSMLRTAFLPANEEGLIVLMLLRLAFMRKLIVTIGHSATRNIDDLIIWNDIHHKTQLSGRPYGYPDPAYLGRVTAELANKGVVLESMTRAEKEQISSFQYHVLTAKTFSGI